MPAAAKLLQSCPTLCDHIDGSPPGSAIPEILQARTLEWVAISFSNFCSFKPLRFWYFDMAALGNKQTVLLAKRWEFIGGFKEMIYIF